MLNCRGKVMQGFRGKLIFDELALTIWRAAVTDLLLLNLLNLGRKREHSTIRRHFPPSTYHCFYLMRVGGIAVARHLLLGIGKLTNAVLHTVEDGLRICIQFLQRNCPAIERQLRDLL